MLLGSVPSPPKKPKSSTRTQSARQSPTITTTVSRSSPGHRPPAVSRPVPIAASAITTNRFTAKPCAPVNDAKLRTQPARQRGLRRARHGLDHAGQRAAAPVQRALPEATSGPGLQHRHAEKERAQRAEDRPAQLRCPPAALGRGDEQACGAVEHRGPRRAEQPGQAGSEDAAEGFAEHPDHQAPAGAGQPGQPGPRSAWCGDQPDAETDLDPDRRGARLDRMVGPARARPVHDVLYPAG